jgi:hypothetical protein
MATLSDPKIDSIVNSPTPGKADVKISYKVHFDTFDVKMNQKYHAHVDIMGDDTKDPQPQAGADDTLWSWGAGDITASMVPTPPPYDLDRTHTIPVPVAALNEDQGSIPNPDEIYALVSLTPVQVHVFAKASGKTGDLHLTL